MRFQPSAIVYAAGSHCFRTTSRAGAAQEIVHRPRRDLRRGNGIDEQARAVRDIAAGKHVGRGRLVGLAVHLDEPALGLDAIGRVRNDRSDDWPMAKITLSAGMSSIWVSSKTGLKRPLRVEHRRAADGPQRP